MTNPNDETKKPNVNTENNNIAVGGLSAGGDIHIGNVYQTSEDDIPVLATSSSASFLGLPDGNVIADS
jgi:hypothetical protein